MDVKLFKFQLLSIIIFFCFAGSKQTMETIRGRVTTLQKKTRFKMGGEINKIATYGLIGYKAP